MAKRKLSPDEKDRIAEERRAKEISAHPDKMISVRVEDETDIVIDVRHGVADVPGAMADLTLNIVVATIGTAQFARAG